tara:strand:+ start:472 stop:678 length:207 start_codon:yes stop_codon:yes gene_type:complete
MPIKSANIDFSNKVTEEKTEKSESELRKEAINQILKDARRFLSISGRVFFVSIFLYGLISLLGDVNVI